jgi:hypothetical protein
VKKTTEIGKVFSTYAQRKGMQQESLWFFLLDGTPIEPTSTP